MLAAGRFDKRQATQKMNSLMKILLFANNFCVIVPHVFRSHTGPVTAVFVSISSIGFPTPPLKQTALS